MGFPAKILGYICICSIVISAQIPDNSLVAHWSFDSYTDNYFADNTGNGYQAVSDTMALTSGIKGKALDKIPDTHDILVSNSASSFDFKKFTIEGWIYSYENLVNPGAFENFRSIFDYVRCTKISNNAGYAMAITDYGKLELTIANPAGDPAWIDLRSDSTLYPNRWYHVAATYDGSTTKLYINGKLAKSMAYSAGLLPCNIPARIGRQFVLTSESNEGYIYQAFKGKIDELKLYNYALDSSSLKAIYDQLNPDKPELIAHWSFDSFTDSIFTDVTGHGFNAISKKGPITDGLKGKALEGSPDINDISVSNSANSFDFRNFTIEGWIYSYENLVNPGAFENFRSIFDYVRCTKISNNAGYAMAITDSGKLELTIANPAGNPVWIDLRSDSILYPNRWYHVAATYDGSTTRLYINGKLSKSMSYSAGLLPCNIPARIGRQFVLTSESNEGYIYQIFQGKIDELKLYNYALDPSAINAIYNEFNQDNPPQLIAHWSFDSLNSSTFYDVTRNSFNASYINSGVTEGMLGNALNCQRADFDIQINNSVNNFNLNKFTIEGWIYANIDPTDPSTFYQDKTIFSHSRTGIQGSDTISGGYKMGIASDGRFSCSMARSGGFDAIVSDEMLKPRTWYHVAFTYNEDSIKMYINGELKKAKKHPGGYPAITDPARIGCEYNINSGLQCRFNGKIDELKLYNYALDDKALNTVFKQLIPSSDPSFEINLGMKTVHAHPGDTVVMPVFLTNFEDFKINSCQLSINYNASVATCLSVSKDSGIINNWQLFDYHQTAPGSITVAMSGTSTPVTYGEGEILRCVFVVNPQAVSDNKCEITLSDILIDEQYSLIKATTSPGKILINNSQPSFGDVTGNGDVNIFDAQKILSYIVGSLTLPDSTCPNFTTAIADVSGNGSVTSYDAALIVQHSIGLLPDFPVAFNALAKRGATDQKTAYLSMVLISGNDNESKYQLIGTNLKGLIAGEFTIACNAKDQELNGATITAIRGATLFSRFDPNRQIIKLALAFKDDIDTSDPVTLVELTIPPGLNLTLQSAELNEGNVKSLIQNPTVNSNYTLTNITRKASISFSHNYLLISNINSENAIVKIWSLDGKMIKKISIAKRGNHKLSIHNAAEGLYIFQIKDGNSNTSGRFILNTNQ